MSIKYFKNFILCGELNYRCLLCKENCQDETTVERHLRWEKHRKALKTQTCMPQYSKDLIFKVDPYYYCTFCNKTMQDIAETKQHIESDIHKNYKSNPEAATNRVEVKLVDDVIFIKSTKISGLQWHGIIDKQCVLCNVAVKNLSSHLHSPEHVVKLIQARVNYVDDKYYRKTDKFTFQCFTCKKTFPLVEFDDHFTNHCINPVHASKVLKKNVDLQKEVPVVTAKDDKSVLSGKGMDKICETEWDIQLLNGIEDDYFDINMNENKITCKKCNKDVKITVSAVSNHLLSHNCYSFKLSSVYKAINNYVDKHYIQRNIDHGAARSKTAQYGMMNYIKMNAGGSKGYCTLCDKFLSASIYVFKAHVAGKYHKGHLELKGLEKLSKHTRGSYKTLFMTEAIATLAYSPDNKMFLFNENLFVNEDSFFLMKRIEHGKYYKKTKCFACDETIMLQDEKEHCVSWQHKSKLLAAKSIYSEDRLPMREIRPNLYHCGICNETLPFWETLLRHCKQISHLLKFKESIPKLLNKNDYSTHIILETNHDNLYMQLLNAVFKTKYVIKHEL